MILAPFVKQRPHLIISQGTIGTVLRIVAIFVLVQFFMGARRPPAEDITSTGKLVKQPLYSNILAPRTPITLYLCLSEYESLQGDTITCLVNISKQMRYGAEADALEWEGMVNVPESVQNNGSIYTHLYMQSGNDVKPFDIIRKDLSLQQSYELAIDSLNIGDVPQVELYSKQRLNVYQVQPKAPTGKYLLSNDGEEVPSATTDIEQQHVLGNDEHVQREKEVEKGIDEGDDEVLFVKSYWPRNLTIQIIDDQTEYKPSAVPPVVKGKITFLSEQERNIYLPVVFYNNFWRMEDDIVLVNDSTPQLPLHIELGFQTPFKWQFFLQV